MTSSRSRVSRNSLLALVAVLAWWCVTAVSPGVADASRRRVVILDLSGPKAKKFHDGIVKVVKKSHTVVPLAKWKSTARDLGVTKPTASGIKKVAKKLKIDAIVEGKIDKRRSAYIVRLKLRQGSTGEVVGNSVETKSSGPRVDANAARDLKDELVAQISDLSTNRGRRASEDEDDEEDAPSRRTPVARRDDAEDDDQDDEDDERDDTRGTRRSSTEGRRDDSDDEDASPSRRGFGRRDDEDRSDEDDTRATRSARADRDDESPSRRGGRDRDDETDDEADPPPRRAARSDDDDRSNDDDRSDEEDDEGGRRGRTVARRDDDESDDESDDEDGIEEGVAPKPRGLPAHLTPGERAVDAVLGVSFNARRLSWSVVSDLGNKPPPYKGIPVAGVFLDATVYPRAIGHKHKGVLRHLGATLMFDKVVKISSKVGDTALATSQSRWAIGATFRLPLGKLIPSASVRFGKQSFTISPAGTVEPGIPNVSYTLLEPMLAVRYQAGPKMLGYVQVGYLAVLGTGDMQSNMQYGPATVSGIEAEVGIDYSFTSSLFGRAALRFETIGHKFRGGTMQTNLRDGDTMNDQDVFGARDMYLGGALTLGYLY